MNPTAGLGFKMEHLDEALASNEPGLWFEVHAENYMIDGGPRLAALTALRAQHPISVHGVGLSIASPDRPDPAHVARLRRLVDLVEPFAVSDHLAWQRWEGVHHADFLPFPRTRAALGHVIDNVDAVQSALGRTIMIENPSHYMDLQGHDYGEAEFLTALARATGCGLLLDVNNIFVSAANLGSSAEAAMAAFPADLIGEIHLAGHAPDSDPESPLLIDTHGAPIADMVWALFQTLVDRIGPRPSLIERDNDVPAYGVLMAERNRAHHLLAAQVYADA
jgi:uncharacterized protein